MITFRLIFPPFPQVDKPLLVHEFRSNAATRRFYKWHVDDVDALQTPPAERSI